MKSIDLLTGTRQALPLGSNHTCKPVVTSPRARLNRCGGVDVLDLRIGKGEQALDVLAVPSVHQTANDLEVLFRHRPRSISPSPGLRVSVRSGQRGVNVPAVRAPVSRQQERRVEVGWRCVLRDEHGALDLLAPDGPLVHVAVQL